MFVVAMMLRVCVVMVLAGVVLPLAAPVTLYNGTGKPGDQGFVYFAQGTGVTQVGNNLNTMADTNASAGFFAVHTLNVLPVLDRQAGYTLEFTVQIKEEDHSGSDRNDDEIGDRAGFSVIALSSDKKGIELGFWPDQVWAQNDGAAQPPLNSNTLFTHGESGLWNTTAATTYQLVVQGDAYGLYSGTTLIVTGPLRDYTPFIGANDVYKTPNFLFLGDDTSSAKADIDLTGPITVASGGVVVTPTAKTLYLPLITR